MHSFAAYTVRECVRDSERRARESDTRKRRKASAPPPQPGCVAALRRLCANRREPPHTPRVATARLCNFLGGENIFAVRCGVRVRCTPWSRFFWRACGPVCALSPPTLLGWPCACLAAEPCRFFRAVRGRRVSSHVGEGRAVGHVGRGGKRFKGAGVYGAARSCASMAKDCPAVWATR